MPNEIIFGDWSDWVNVLINIPFNLEEIPSTDPPQFRIKVTNEQFELIKAAMERIKESELP